MNSKSFKNTSPHLIENLTLIRLNEHLLEKAQEVCELFREDDCMSDIDISDENSNDIMPKSNITISTAGNSFPTISNGNIDISIVKSELQDNNL